MIDRAGHYETLTRLIDGAQQIEIGADDSPYALNPWDVPDPAKVSREKIAFLLALHQVMMGGLDGRQVGMIGAAIRAVYAKAAALPGSRPRESMLQEELRAQARGGAGRRTRSTSPRRFATSPTACRSTAARAPTPICWTARRPCRCDARLVVFDTRRCPDSELRLVMFQIMEYVTTTVERHWRGAQEPWRAEPGAPLFQGRSIMLIDEAWHLISRPETGEYANNLARRARHLGLVLIVMSPAAVGLRHRVRGGAAGQLLPAAAARAEPEGDPVHRRDAAALRARGGGAGAAEDRQGPPRADAVAERHARARQGRAQGRPDRVLGVHLTTRPRSRCARPRSRAHGGNVWAAIAALAKRGTRGHRDQRREVEAEVVA